MRALAVIPARLASTRLPHKVLREIAGKPMLAWVYEAARASGRFAQVLVATDSDEVMALCRKLGFESRLTSPAHRSGTERVHEVAQSVAADVYVNLQGDEPLTRPEHMHVLLDLMLDTRVRVGTLCTPAATHDISNPNAVKTVLAADGRALYFSRATIPHDRDRSGTVRYLKHLGFYAYRREALDRFVAWPESRLECAERLEQLRFLENGIAIHVAETPFDTVGVDTETDLQRAANILTESQQGRP